MKKQRSSKYYALLASAFTVFIAMTATAPAAVAQDGAIAVDDIEEVVITGTRRKDRTIADSNVPIDVLNADSLTSTGLTETNSILANLLPSFNFPQPSLTDGTDHVRPAQLRGLAPDHTLVLVNGKRRHGSALLNLNGSVGRGSSAVDLNTIPANAIKRIEVLRDGAAAQYGSDAIAGVINVVLKDAQQGGAFSVSYGAYNTTLDGVPQLESVTIDPAGNMGMGSLKFTTGKDRKRTDGETLTLRGNIGFGLGDGGFFNASIEYRDRNATNRSDYDDRIVYSRINNTTLDPRELTYNRYNTRFGNANVEDVNIFYNAALPVGKMELYSFGSYNNRTGDSAGFNRLPGNSRNVPAIYPDGFLPLITSDIDDLSFAIGLRGQISEWDFDLSAVYGSDDFNFGVTNSVNTSLGATSPTTFDAGHLINTQFSLNADFSKLVEVGFLDNPVNFAFGGEFRNENYEIKAGEEASYVRGTVIPAAAAGSQVFPGFAPASEVDDGRDSFALYLEIDVDATSRWNVAVAGRFENYSDFGSTFNWKLASRYFITETFAVRGSVSTGFRAPSLVQQYFTSIATVFVNSVPTETGTFRPGSSVAQALGSPGLKEEISSSFSGGVSWTPVDDLSITVDYYDVKIKDRIVLSSNLSGTVIQDLLAGTGANRARFFLNGIDSRTKGIDVVTSYKIRFGDRGGTLNLNAGFNYSDNKVTNIIDPPAILQQAGIDQSSLFDTNEFRRFEEGSPETKLNLGTSWFWNALSVTVRATRYGKTIEPSNNPARVEVLSSAWITDLDIKYDITKNVAVSIGANNLFDVYPKATRHNVADVTRFARIFPYSSFSPYGFSGRYLYGTVAANF